MSHLVDILAWASVPLALAFATLHAVFRARHTLALTTLFIVLALVFCLQSVWETKQLRAERLNAAVMARATPAQLQQIQIEDSQSPRLHFALYVLAASIVPLFIGEYRRKQRESAQTSPS
jgi:hypothetical protein